jgi:hypothetical protein
LCATGQKGKNPVIIVWEAETKLIVNKFYQGENTNSVRIIKFYNKNRFLFTIDSSFNHNLHIFDRQEGL